MKLTPDKETLRRRRNHVALALIFSAITVCILLAVLILVGGTLFVLVATGVFSTGENGLMNGKLLLGLTLLALLVIGAVLAYFSGRIVMKPVNMAIEGMNQLASGKFDTRLSYHGPFAKQPPLSTFSESFNKMAAELEGTELLRNDFVNSFSHEFKTPIVSISGFAELLLAGDLSREQEHEYLTIIAEESRRLSGMAVGMLDLTRLEKQRILVDEETFNLSEQLLDCALLLQNRWEAKNLELCLDFDEFTYTGEKRLLQELWLNLLDNAVKFSPEYGTVSVSMEEDEYALVVSVSNTGSTILPEDREKVFRKFYQGDRSRACQGNGIGLSIVKLVTELHGGTVEVSGGEDLTVFTVTLPR